MTSSQTNETNLKKDFQNLEKEALKEISLEIIKSDLQKSLSQLHQKNMGKVGNKLSIIKEDCRKEIQEGIKKHIQEQLEEHFQNVIQSCQTDISNLIDPILRRAEQDLNSLNNKVSQTNTLCAEIQKKYAFRWEKPFLILILGTSLSGALMGLILFFLQVPFVSVLLMNEKIRAIHEIGVNTIVDRRDREIRELHAQSTPVPVLKKKKTSKGK